MDENRAAFANTAPNERMTDAYWTLSGITMFSGLAAAGKTARANTVRGLAGGNVRLHLFNVDQPRLEFASLRAMLACLGRKCRQIALTFFGTSVRDS
jgi:hypothetical protein